MEQQQIEVPTQAPTQTEPLGPQVHAPEPKPEAKPETPAANPRAAVEAAMKRATEAAEAAEAKTAPAKVEPKVDAKAEEAKAERTRAEDGKFQANQKVAEAPAKATDATDQKAAPVQSEARATRYEAPSRFNDQGKAEWDGAPESVKAEVTRALKENEDGIKRYKESADRYEKLREYDELARKNGREGVHESLKQVREIEDAFQRNPIEGLKKITDHFGLNLQAVAAHIVGQQPNQQVAEAHSKIQQLEAKIKAYEDEKAAPTIVNDFFTQNEEASKYTQAIAGALELGIVQTLDDAWKYARLYGKPDENSGNTASEATGSQPLTPAQTASAQTDAAAQPNPAGQKSVTGAPSSISEIAKKSEASKTPFDAVRKAAARLG